MTGDSCSRIDSNISSPNVLLTVMRTHFFLRKQNSKIENGFFYTRRNRKHKYSFYGRQAALSQIFQTVDLPVPGHREYCTQWRR